MTKGAFYKFREPMDLQEASARFLLLDDPAEYTPEDRLDFEEVCNLPIPPVRRFMVSEMVRATQGGLRDDGKRD
jgi:hypothetical protein